MLYICFVVWDEFLHSFEQVACWLSKNKIAIHLSGANWDMFLFKNIKHIRVFFLQLFYWTIKKQIECNCK